MVANGEASIDRVKDFLGEDSLTLDRLYQTSKAEVLFRNDAAIISSFPSLGETNESNVSIQHGPGDGISNWLLRFGGLVSEGQLLPNPANTAFETSGRALVAFRPPRYGRAAVLPFISNDMFCYLDIKGCGVAPGMVPRVDPHGSGLLALHEAVAELVHARVLAKLFRAADVDVTVLPIYGIVFLGFFENRAECKPMPAVTLLRCAHRRPVGNVESPFLSSSEATVKLRIELILRRFGLTSVSPRARIEITEAKDGLQIFLNGLRAWHISSAHVAELLRRRSLTVPAALGAINVQLTREVSAEPLSATLVDYGAFDSVEDVNLDAVLLVQDAPFNFGPILTPALAGDLFGSRISNSRMRRRSLDEGLMAWGRFTPMAGTNLRAAICFGFDIVRQFEAGRLTPALLEAQVADYVDHLSESLFGPWVQVA